MVINGETMEVLPRAETIRTIQDKMQIALPAYSRMDRTEFDAFYLKEDPKERGQLLTFHTENENGQNHSVSFIFQDDVKPYGFAPYYMDLPPSENPNIKRLSGNSLLGRRFDGSFQMGEIDFAVERLKINLEGVDPTDEEFGKQFVGWSEKRGFITMKELIDDTAVYKQTKGTKKRRDLRIALDLDKFNSIWDLFDENPEKAKELATARIENNPPYVTFEGIEQPTQYITDEIKRGSIPGQKATLRELYKIESYERILKDFNLLMK